MLKGDASWPCSSSSAHTAGNISLSLPGMHAQLFSEKWRTICTVQQPAKQQNTYPVLFIKFSCFVVHLNGSLVFPQKKPVKAIPFLLFSCFETLLCDHRHLCHWEMMLFASSPETGVRNPENFVVWAISQHCSLSEPRSSILRSVTWLEMQGMNPQAPSSAFVSKGKHRWSKANRTLRDRKGSAGQVYTAPGSTFSSGSGNWRAIYLA